MHSQLAGRRAKDWNPAKAQEKAFQPQAFPGKFAYAAAHISAISSDEFDDSTITSQPLPAAVDLTLVETFLMILTLLITINWQRRWLFMLDGDTKTQRNKL